MEEMVFGKNIFDGNQKNILMQKLRYGNPRGYDPVYGHLCFNICNFGALSRKEVPRHGKKF